MTVQPRIGCFIYNRSTFWSMLAHGITTRAAQLLGTTMILVGISPELAQTIVQIGMDLSRIRTFSTVREGLIFAQSMGARGR